MQYYKAILIIMLLSIFGEACTERIDIKLDESFTKLVVDGAVTTDKMAHSVALSKTSSYYYNQPAIMVTGAHVNITDGDLTYNLTENSPGIYSTVPSLYGIAGHKYTLHIKLASQIGGYTDYTASSILNPGTPLD